MKKLSALALLLCFALVFQLAAGPVSAATEEPTEAPTLPVAVPEAGQEAAFGTATVLSGCRTMEAMMPLGGNDLILDTALSAIIYELNTGTMVTGYYPDDVVLPGGMTKMMTALVAMEQKHLDDEVTISTQNFKKIPAGARTSKLKEGEILTLRDLIYCMFLDWSNDAALSVAEYVAGSEEAFVKLMNEKARQIGCTNTAFVNCRGQDEAGQATTARDMAKITAYALKNPSFRELYNCTSYNVPKTNKTDKTRQLRALNYLTEETWAPKYNDRRVTGGFASYSDVAGASISFTAEKNGLSYLMILMGARRTYDDGGKVQSYGNYEEAWDMLAYAFDNFKVCGLLHEGQSMSQFAVAGGENEVVGQTHASMDAVLPINAKQINLTFKYAVENGGLTAPIQDEQKIATLQIWYRSSCVAETEIYAMSEVREAANSGLKIHSAARTEPNLSGVLSFIGTVCLVILALFVVYLVVNRIRLAIARNRRRKRRNSRRRSR